MLWSGYDMNRSGKAQRGLAMALHGLAQKGTAEEKRRNDE